MNYAEFMTRVQDYFGPYPDQSRVPAYVAAYLKRDIDEEKLNVLFRYLSYSHPVNYGAPDIAAIETAIIWGMKNNKGSDVHKSRARDASEIFDPIELTDEEREISMQILDGLRDKIGGMSMRAREANA